MFKFVLATLKDAKVLAEVSKQAFDSDVDFGAPGPGGPPGYDSPNMQRWVMNQKNWSYYKILSENDQIIGGFFIEDKGRGELILQRIFVDPEYHGQGAGIQAMEFALSLHTDAKCWKLDTPAWNTRTRQFYQKLGFQIVKEDQFLYFEKRIS